MGLSYVYMGYGISMGLSWIFFGYMDYSWDYNRDFDGVIQQ